MSTVVLCYEGADGNPVAVSAATPLPLSDSGAVSSSEVGQPNGVASLDGSGKIPTSQMPVGDVTYIGNWNATTNTPTLANGVGTSGDLYICDVAGTQNLGGGSVDYGVGDWLIYDGAEWDRVTGHGPAPANPSVTVGLTAKNGSAATFMRSDGAPALDQAIVPTWTGAHTFTQTMTAAAITASGLIQSSGGVAGNTTVTAGIGSNSVRLSGAPNGTDPTITALGVTDANVSIAFAPKGTGLLKFNGNTITTGNAYVAGQLGSANNTNAPSPTNSGITIGGSPTWAMMSLYDQANAANGRSADLLLISNAIKLRFANDARNAFLDVLTINGGQPGVTGITSTSGSGAWAHTGGFTVNGNSFAPIVASDGKVAQAANVNVPALYAVPTSGLYRFSAYVVQSQAATTSSTLPACRVEYTEATTGVAVGDDVTTTANTNQVGLHVGASVVIAAQEGSNIGYITTGYASSGATPMQYAVHVKIEFLG